jgi:hypothetical protein
MGNSTKKRPNPQTSGGATSPSEGTGDEAEGITLTKKIKVYASAGLSTLDLLTDVYMIYEYATTGQQGAALNMAIMVVLCLLGQLALIWVQTLKGPRLVMLKEMLIVLSGTKPGVYAMRVAKGNEPTEHAAISPALELTCTKGFEMACESIPGTRANARAECSCPTVKALGACGIAER